MRVPFLLTAATLLLAAAASAQSPEAPSTQLQTLLAAQQTALANGDPAQIVATSRPAAALALRLAATLDLAANQPVAASQPAATQDLLRRSGALDPQPATALLLLTADLRMPRSPDLDPDTAAFVALAGATAPTHLLLAQTFQAADDLPRTIRELAAALALDPALPSAHLALGAAFWQLNEFQYNADSLREFTVAQQQDPVAFLPNFDLGSLLSQYHRFPEAARFLATAAAADPASPDPHFQLGMDLYAQADASSDPTTPDRTTDPSNADPTHARPELERAVALTGTDLAHNAYGIRRALAILARIAAREGRPEDARTLNAQVDHIHDLLVSQAAAPNLSESTGLLVGAGLSPARPAEASAGAPTATQLPAAAAPNPVRQQLLTVAATTLNDAGTALARTHDYAAALPLFREAAAADPSLTPVLRNLGLAAFHTGNLPEAAKALTEALQLDPTDTLARRYLDQIPRS